MHAFSWCAALTLLSGFQCSCADWPGFFLNAFANDAYLEGLARCYEQGLCQAVGASNFNAQRVQKAAKFFEGRGTCLASNQVQYSLLYRTPERNGVMEACAEAGTTLVAYSPICQGLLSGKYSKANPPQGPRRAFFTDSRFEQVSVLLDLMRKIGEEQGGKSPTQVRGVSRYRSIAVWCTQQNVCT